MHQTNFNAFTLSHNSISFNSNLGWRHFYSPSWYILPIVYLWGRLHRINIYHLLCYIHFFILTIYKTLNQCFYSLGTNRNIRNCMPVSFGKLKELKQFWGILKDSYFNKWTLAQKMQNIMFDENYYM